jgi:diguanylate cyclase (GGDEF)-like protein
MGKRKLNNLTRVMGIAALSLSWLCACGQRSIFEDTSQGLGNLNIDALAQDRAGFLWVGTENGLYRFDGFRFQRYGSEEGLRGQVIRSLFAGPDGTLWAGTTTGIFFQRPDGSFVEVHPPTPLNQFSLEVGSVFSAPTADRVVVAERSGAYLLRRLAADQWTAEAMPLPAHEIWGLHYDGSGALWYGCDFDLCLTAQGSTRRLRATAQLPADHWRSILEDGQGHLWLRGEQHLAEFFPQTGRAELRDLPGRPDKLPSLGLTQNAKGQIVVAQGQAFALWEGNHWRTVTERNGLEPFDITAIFIDRLGVLWIGQVGHGLKRWVGEGRWEAYTAREGLSNNAVGASLRDRAGRLWIGTDSGLDWIPAGENTPRPWKAGGASMARTVALAESADGAIWVGSQAGGVARIDPRTQRTTSWKTPAVYRILADSQQRLWIATAAGLYVVDAPGAAPHLMEDRGIQQPHRRFTDLSVGADKQFWAATDIGLYRWDGTHWRHIDPGLSGVVPTQIAADRQGNLWAAGAYPGLVRLRVGSDRIQEAEHISRPLLLSERIASLAVDRRGWLWVGQDAGLILFDGRNWRRFSAGDGLLWDDCNPYALSEDRDGSLWIGTSGGLAHLLDPPAAAVLPSQALALSQGALGTVPWSNHGEVRWSQSPLSIAIAALDFGRARPAHLRYRLLGWEKEWERTSEGTIRYSRLTPGAYHLQVVAEDAGGDDASPPLEIDFRILPRWWQSAPLRWGLLGLAMLAIAPAWLRWKRHRASTKLRVDTTLKQHLEELEQERASLRQVRERMRHLGEFDDLTGLWNRRTILDRLRGEVDRSRRHQVPLSVILLDLDHLQKMNEESGRHAGDRILQEIGRILLRAVRSYDWVGRYGGGEFLVVLPGSDGAAANSRAEQLRVAIEMARPQDGQTRRIVTASLGVATGSQASYEQLVETAGEALRQAKHFGRNCVVTLDVATVQNTAQMPST